MTLSDVESYIVDVDGTLYSQKKVRIGMIMNMIRSIIINPKTIREIVIIYHFRKMREQNEYKNCNMYDLFSVLADKKNLCKEEVSKTVDYWMFQVPLQLLKKYKYSSVIEYINREYLSGKTIIIYSDYPAESKVTAMDVMYNMIFVSGEGGLEELKPSEKSMLTIISTSNINPQNTLYIGDRDEKDGISANLVGTKYIDIKMFMKEIKRMSI